MLYLKPLRKWRHIDKYVELSPGFQAHYPFSIPSVFHNIITCFSTLPHCTPFLPLLPIAPTLGVIWGSLHSCSSEEPHPTPGLGSFLEQAPLPWKKSRHPIRPFTSRTITSPFPRTAAKALSLVWPFPKTLSRVQQRADFHKAKVARFSVTDRKSKLTGNQVAHTRAQFLTKCPGFLSLPWHKSTRKPQPALLKEGKPQASEKQNKMSTAALKTSCTCGTASAGQRAPCWGRQGCKLAEVQAAVICGTGDSSAVSTYLSCSRVSVE